MTDGDSFTSQGGDFVAWSFLFCFHRDFFSAWKVLGQHYSQCTVCAMLLGAVGCNIDVIGEPRVARIGRTWTFSAAGFQDSYGELWTRTRT